MILLLFISLICRTQQADIAKYNLAGISTKTILSTGNSTFQPQIKFPSVINPPDTTNDPAFTNYGLEITHQKYIVIDSPWIQNTDVCTDINIWLYWNTGLLGEFGAVSLGNNAYQKYMVLNGNAPSSSPVFTITYGTQTISGGNFRHGWHIISIGICSEYLFSVLYKYNLPSIGNNLYAPGIGNYISSNPLYLGCKNCSDSTISYYIHSISISSGKSTTAFNPPSAAMFNIYGCCGDGSQSCGESCDDNNLVSGDGCSDTCNTEPGYRCNFYNLSPYGYCDKCGNERKFDREECDDGNTLDGDGCNSTCYREPGWNCTGGSSTNKDICRDYCGDGKNLNTSSSNYCDDGNRNDDDGCNSGCITEIGWTCSGGSPSGKDTCTEICGDSKRFNSLSTYCDDGNIISGDGCSSTCGKEIGWTCSGGSKNSNDVCTEICGDGKKFNSIGTYCDDGNLISGDGCGSTCGIESGWSCTGGTSTAKDTCTENCGDGIRFNSVSTYCDDGNVNNGDGCSSTCYKEIGWICSGGSLTAKDTCIEVCGDGMKFNSLSTYCDDGNSFNGDGCSLSCDVESGWKCTGGNASTNDICSDLCGDGIRFNSYSTYCDDGNKINGDGCSSVCSVETGFTCTGGSTSSADTCTEACGDGKRFTTVGSYCDDGNNSNGDGCNSVCGIESGWTCSGGTSTTKDICTEICGDGKKYNSISTYCDDGNNINGDGCSSTCSVETYWTCSGGSSTNKDSCIEHCGDGKRFNSISIYCDDGNIINNDGCSSTCSVESGWTCSGGSSITKDICVEVCGDGKKFNTISTYCDDGNTLNGDGCNSSCSIETGWTCSGGTSTLPDTCVDICGDGKKYGSLSTKCDDGNKVNGDGCSMSCNVEVGWTCSGGTPTSADTCTEICGDGIRFNIISTYCDDGNLANGDGCSSTCVKETGWVCGGGSSTSKDICNDICGDGKKYSSAINFCDDGNTINNDGCSYACSVETGWICSGGTPSNPDTCTEICNDGIRFNSVSTYCDDGNAINKDGCDSSCNVETGYYCTGGTPSTKDSCFEICGDGIRFNSINMYCDDGNIISGDGCNNICGIESGWFCFGGSTTRSDICTEICGDGIRINSYNNYCDDGNHINGDGCSMACGVELGWKCDGGGLTSKDSCSEICGDGIRFNTNTTYCDDGDLAEGDGCNLSCVIENGWGCSGGNSTKEDICSEICGDGIRFNNRSSYCDDGNVVDGDGCSSKCKVEPQFKCSGGNSTTIDVCRPLLIVSTQEATACSTTQTAAGVGATLSAGTSIMTMSSPVGIFSMINQFQMLLLIIISGVYLSDGVKATITGMGYSMLNFDFLQFERIDMFGNFINFITFDQTNESLTEIGITSGNSFVNVFKLMLLTITIIMIHILLIPVISKCRNCKKESKYNKFGNKLYYFLTFALYVRLILQSYLIIALSAISEIAVFDVSNSIKITSFIISLIFLLGIITFSLICWYQIWKAHPDITLSNQIYFIEFFNGLKNTTYSRLFPAIYMLQRILCAAFLFSFSKLDPRIKMCFLAFINLISLLYLLIVRPYTNFKNLLLECLSQTLVSIFSCMLIYFATESKWNDIVTWIFIGLIMVSTLISMIISIIDLILNIRKLIQKCYKPSKVSNDQENTKVEITQNNSYISKMQSISNRMHQTREEYKIDLSESDPTTINIQLDIEHPKPQFPILNRRYIFGR